MNLAVKRTWFEISTSSAVVEFDKPINVDLVLLKKSVSIAVKDMFQEDFTDFALTSINKSEDNTRLFFRFAFERSIYNSTIKINQSVRKSIISNEASFFPANEQFQIEKVTFLKSKVRDSLVSFEKVANIIIWILMILLLIPSAFSGSRQAAAFMKVLSYCTMISHMNGPYLHSSDLLFDIIGKAGSQMFFKNQFQTSNETNQCVPPGNFTKRYDGYNSCGVLNLAGGSILTFLVFGTISLGFILISHCLSKKQIRVSMQKEEVSVDKSSAKWLILSRYLGVSFLLIYLDALAPSILHLSFLNISKTNGSMIMAFGTVVSLVISSVYLLILFMMYRFSKNLSDIFYLESIRLGPNRKSKKNNSPNVEGLKPLKESEDVQNEERFNKDGEKENANSPIIEKRKIPIEENSIKQKKLNTNKLDQFESMNRARNTENKSFSGSSGSSPKRIMTIGPQDSLLDDVEQKRIDYNSMKYPLMAIYMSLFKQQLDPKKQSFYNLPLLDLLSTYVSQFVIVQFSEDGMSQIYVVFIFELVLVISFIMSNLYRSALEKTLDLLVRGVFVLICIVKMFNFSIRVEESLRQGLLDTMGFVLGCLFLIIGIITAGVQCSIGILKLKGWKVLCEEEISKLDTKIAFLIKIKKKQKTEFSKIQNDSNPEMNRSLDPFVIDSSFVGIKEEMAKDSIEEKSKTISRDQVISIDKLPIAAKKINTTKRGKVLDLNKVGPSKSKKNDDISNLNLIDSPQKRDPFNSQPNDPPFKASN